MYATVGILAALRHAEATGEGQQIDLALVDSQMAWLVNEGTNFLLSGQSPKRRGNGHPNIVPYDVFPTKDGHVILAVGNDGQFRSFCGAFGRDDLAGDARFATNPLRIANRDALQTEIVETFDSHTSDSVLTKLQSAGVPCGPIYSVAQALTSEQAKARSAVINVPAPHVTSGSVDLLGNPLKLSKTPVKYTLSPPTFGAHTDKLSQILNVHAKKRRSQKS
jgi:formyl-CoA transferase